MKALVAFGTKYGSTIKVAEEIAMVLTAKGWEVKVLDLRQGTERVETYDLVIVGSSIIMGNWSKEALRFLQNSRTSLEGKDVALFACCGDIMLNPGREADHKKRYLEDVADRFALSKDVPMGLFGGELDFNKYGFLVRTFLNGRRKGLDPSKPFDFRDWDAIRAWASMLVEM